MSTSSNPTTFQKSSRAKATGSHRSQSAKTNPSSKGRGHFNQPTQARLFQLPINSHSQPSSWSWNGKGKEKSKEESNQRLLSISSSSERSPSPSNGHSGSEDASSGAGGFAEGRWTRRMSDHIQYARHVTTTRTYASIASLTRIRCRGSGPTGQATGRRGAQLQVRRREMGRRVCWSGAALRGPREQTYQRRYTRTHCRAWSAS